VRWQIDPLGELVVHTWDFVEAGHVELHREVKRGVCALVMGCRCRTCGVRLVYGRVSAQRACKYARFRHWWDNPKFGWGAVVQWLNNPQGGRVACPWDPVVAEDAEMHGEAKGGVGAPAAALRFADLRRSERFINRALILRGSPLPACSWLSHLV